MNHQSKRTTVAKKAPTKKAVDQSQPRARSMKAFNDATTIIQAAFSPESLAKVPIPTANKSTIDALQVLHSQLAHHHTKDQFITLSRENDIPVFVNLMKWFLKRANTINQLPLNHLQLITTILTYINAIPVAKLQSDPENAPETRESKSPTTKKSKQTDHQAQDLAQHFILQQVFQSPTEQASKSTPDSIFESLFKIMLTNYSTTTSHSTIVKSQYYNSLLTLLYQIIQFCVYFRNEVTLISTRANFMSDSTILQLYTLLAHFFNSFLPDGNWAASSRLDLDCIATIITISSALIMYDTPVESTETDDQTRASANELEQNNQSGSKDQAVVRLNSSPDAITAICTIIFRTISSFIMYKLQNQIHPFISHFSGSNASDIASTSTQLINTLNTTQLPAKELNYCIFNNMVNQTYAQAHYLTVCSTHYLHSRSQQIFTPQEQARTFQTSPYFTFINTDLIKLFILYFKYLDQSKSLSMEDHQQTSIRNIILVLFGSGNRFHISLFLQADYFEFLISLVWDQSAEKSTNANLTAAHAVKIGGENIINTAPFTSTHGKPRPSAVLLNPSTLAPKTSEQKKALEQTYQKQQQIEFNRVAFFCNQLDAFSLFQSTGYASRMLLLKQYNIVEVLFGVLVHKVYGMDAILRKQSTIVEKIALFIKNFISSIDLYNEFDYSMFMQLVNIDVTLGAVKQGINEESTFASLKQRTVDWMTAEYNGKAVENDVIEQRLADDIYSIFISTLFSRFQFHALFAVFIPTLCLYYDFPAITPDRSDNKGTIENADEKPILPTDNTMIANEMDLLFQNAMISGGQQTVDNNYIIISDLINFSHFAPLFHLFSYLSFHFTSASAHRVADNTDQPNTTIRSIISPIQRFAFASLLQLTQAPPAVSKEAVALVNNTGDIDQICHTLFTQIAKTLTKSILLGLHIKNGSNDNPHITMKDLFTKQPPSDPENDAKSSISSQKIDALVSQVTLFALSMFNNKKYSKYDENQEKIADVHGFVEFPTVDAFLTEAFPTTSF